jgi:hypothetical protein
LVVAGILAVGGGGESPWWWLIIPGAAGVVYGLQRLHLLESDYDDWYWWFLPAVAWLVFAKVMVTRKSLG